MNKSRDAYDNREIRLRLVDLGDGNIRPVGVSTSLAGPGSCGYSSTCPCLYGAYLVQYTSTTVGFMFRIPIARRLLSFRKYTNRRHEV